MSMSDYGGSYEKVNTMLLVEKKKKKGKHNVEMCGSLLKC